MTIRQLHPTLTKPWFCFDGDESEYFATEQEAIDASEMAIMYYLDDTWDASVENVQVGKITAISTKLDVEERPDTVDAEGIAGDGSYWPAECIYKCDYKALPLTL